MRVRQIDTRILADVNRFLQFPGELYRNCPQWCPRWEASVRGDMDRRRHPFYEHSTAEYFLAEDGTKVVGRIAALENRHYNAYHGKRTGFFHYFDVVEDYSVAEKLLAAVRNWMLTRGLTESLGPYGLLKLDGGGILVEGFGESAAMGIAYNYSYYDDYLRRAGLVKQADYLSGRVDAEQLASKRMRLIAERARERHNFSIKTFSSRSELRDWLPRIAEVYERSFQDQLGYYPRTLAERDWISGEMMRVADPSLIKLIISGEKIAGFLLAFPDWRAGLRRSLGRLWPLGWYQLWRDQQQTKWCQISHMGLLPEFRRRGGNALLYTEIDATLREKGYHHAEISLSAEANDLILADQEVNGVRWIKRHRLYFWKL
jgi:hypothetical protein